MRLLPRSTSVSPAAVVPAAPETGARGGVLRPLLLVAIYAAWNYASDVVSARLHTDELGFASPWKLPLVVLGFVFALGGLVGLGSVVWGRTSLRALGWTFENPRRLILVGLLQLGVFLALVVGVYAAFGGLQGVRELAATLVTMPLGRRLYFAVMGSKVAFVEETLFRGDLLRAVESRFGGAAAVVASSAVFAVYHRTLEPVPLAMKFLMGLLFAASALRTRSLLPSTLAHALLWAIVCDN
jgi:membrane protease YdiL (CAAX protease family)